MVILCDGSAHLRRDLCDVRVVSNCAGCATDGMIQRENAPMRSSGLLKNRLLEEKKKASMLCFHVSHPETCILRQVSSNVQRGPA